MRYEDFTILFTAKDGRYKARVISSPGGEVTGDFVPPFYAAAASHLIGKIHRTSRDIQSAESSSRQEVETVNSLEDVGSALFEALFSGAVGNLFHRCMGHVSERELCGLRLKLRLNPSEEGLETIYDLPWEFLYRRETKTFLALSRATSIVRYLDVPQPAISVPLPSPLRVLVALPNPLDTTRLDLNTERQLINKAFRRLGREIEITVLQKATIKALRVALVSTPYHIFHFSGHGILGKSESAGLVFEDESGGSHFVDASSLAGVLTNSTSIRLAVINACHGAAIMEGNIFTSVASSLVLGGIPAVIANKYPITDAAAIVFSEQFYEALASGRSLDEAVEEGRMAIYRLSGSTGEWGVPSLFSRLAANSLFSPKHKDGKGHESLRSAALEALRSVGSESETFDQPARGQRQQGNETDDSFHPMNSVVTFEDSFKPVRDLTEFVYRELEAGHKQARDEADRWSRASLRAAAFCLLLIVATLALLFNGQIDAGKVSAALSLITTSASSLFFVQARAANRRMDASLRELSLARDVHVALEITATISDKAEKDRIKASIVSSVLGNANRKDLPKSAAQHVGPVTS